MVPAVTRIAVIDPQPAVRAGLSMLLRTEPGLVPVGAAAGAHDGAQLADRLRPDVVLLEPHLLDGDGLGLCRRLRAASYGPRVLLYHGGEPDPALPILARVAGADALVDKSDDPAVLFEAIRVVARGGQALPAVSPEALAAAAHRVEADDLALLAMLVDGTSTGDVAAALRLDERRVARRTERVLGRLRARRREPSFA
jgi:DNA-binding NarL/FixJ family response regulator